MFCEKCGTRIDDGAPFCPNCGNRVGASEAAPAPEASPASSAPMGTAPVNPGLNNIPAAPAFQPAAPRAGLKLPSCGGLFDKFNNMKGLGQIFYGCTCILLVLCFIFSLLRLFSVYGQGISLALGAPWLLVISNILFTLCITFFLLDYFDRFSLKGLWLLIVGSAGLIFLLFLIKWIAGIEGYSVHLSVGGWFFLLFQAGLTAVSVLYLLEKKKN